MLTYGSAFIAAHGPVTYEGLISTRAGCYYSFGGNQKIMSRSAHMATTDITTLRIAEGNGYFDENANAENFPATTTTITAAVEYAGQFSQFAWGGNLTGSVAPGAVVECDNLTLPSKIPKGSWYWLRRYLVSSGSTVCGWAKNPQTANGDLCNLNASTDQTMGGTITGTSVWSPPFAIIGQTAQPSVIVADDSTGYGPRDESINLVSDFRRGKICHGFPADTMAFLNHSNSTIKASNYIAASTMRRAVWKYASHGIIGLGRNDIDAGDSAATLEGNITSLIIPQFNRPGGCTIILATLTPKSSSGASPPQWESDADQTANANNSVRVTYNGHVRAVSISGVTNFFDPGAAVESVLNGGKWLGVVGTSKFYTQDGLHPNENGYPLCGAAVLADISKIHM